MSARTHGVLTADRMRDLLRKQCELAGSQRAWAKKNDFSAAFISDVLLARRDVTESLAKALGYKRRVTFHVAYFPDES